MSKPAMTPIRLELPLYALPADTDASALLPLACEAVASLEDMGNFNQREYEPAHLFGIAEGKKP